jgi:hypothetical protein
MIVVDDDLRTKFSLFLVSNLAIVPLVEFALGWEGLHLLIGKLLLFLSPCTKFVTGLGAGNLVPGEKWKIYSRPYYVVTLLKLVNGVGCDLAVNGGNYL